MSKNNIKIVLNKRYALKLIKMGFPLLNVEASEKYPGEITFFFQGSDEIEKAFSVLINEVKILKNMNGLNLEDFEIILKVLQNYEISDNQRFLTMEKIQTIIDMVYDVKPYSGNENIETEAIADIDVSSLKKSMMSGCK